MPTDDLQARVQIGPEVSRPTLAEAGIDKNLANRAQTANLQPSRVTVKDAARLMNVSERLIYMAKEVERLRPDLVPRIEAGELSLNKALRLAKGKPKPTSWDRLVRAWNNATEDDRARLALWILRAEREQNPVADRLRTASRNMD